MSGVLLSRKLRRVLCGESTNLELLSVPSSVELSRRNFCNLPFAMFDISKVGSDSWSTLLLRLTSVVVRSVEDDLRLALKELDILEVLPWLVKPSGNIVVGFTEVERLCIDTGCFVNLLDEFTSLVSSLNNSDRKFLDLANADSLRIFSLCLLVFVDEELIMTVSVKCNVPQLESVVDKGSTTMYGLIKID